MAMSWPIGYGEGRARQGDALRSTIERLGGSNPLGGADDLLLLGIGASYAALATPLCVLRQGGVAASRSDCSDFPAIPRRTTALVVGVSQSGRSVETTDVVARHNAAGVPSFAIINAETSPLGDVANESFTLGGLDDSRVSTVGFVGTFAALGVFAERAALVALSTSWADLPEIIESAVAGAADVLAAFAREHMASGFVDVVASAEQLSAAEGPALLLREGPLVASAAYDTRGYLHGPMDVAGGDVSHIVVGGARERQLVDQLSERAGAALLLAEREHLRGDRPYEVVLPKGLSESQRALVSVCILQELVAQVALVRGNAIDDAVFVRQDTKIA